MSPICRSLRPIKIRIPLSGMLFNKLSLTILSCQAHM
ncbi:hypothetical protein EVA_20908 [gut metagenome]|uniref:Uncharacterized protein n=1 Tax=gut metagenome TaxID=749906 RepID=J9F7V4_9ZZZZ